MKVVGLILAGGVSKRFGGVKSLAVIDGEPMIKKVARVMHEAVGNVYLSVKTAEMGSQLLDQARPYVSDFIVDDFEAGPLGGVLTAARRIETDVFMTVSTDVPFMRSGSLRSLLNFLIDYGADAASIVWGNGCVETLIQAIKRESILNYCIKYLSFRRGFARPSDSLRSAEKLLLVHATAVTKDPLEFTNINTVEDLTNPKPRGPLKGHVKDNILIADAAKHFAKAVAEYSEQSYFSAGVSYALEAATYLKHGITHVASHAFYDSAAVFKQTGAVEVSTFAEHLASQTSRWMNV